MGVVSARAALVRLLIERLGRHRPRYLSERQAVLIIRRLVKHAIAGERGCCLWGGALNNDHYGRISVRLNGRHRTLYVHQLAYELAHDPKTRPHWIHVSHLCDTPPCFHPEHVRAERRRDNQQRAALNTHRKKALKRPWREELKEAA